MNSIIKEAAASFAFLLVCILEVHAGVHITNEAQIGAGSITGPGEKQSVVTDKGIFSNLLNLNYYRESEKLNYYFNFSGRATNDKSIDYRPFSVARIQGRLSLPRHNFTLGDFMESFSRYSLGASLKGISYSTKLTAPLTPDLTLIYGMQAPRWDSIIDPDNSTKALKREAYGFKISASPLEAWNFSVHYVNSKDKNRIYESVPLYDGGVYGIGWSFDPFAGLSLTGETSFSSVHLKPSSGSLENKNGSANRVSFQGYGDGLRLNLDYERVSSNFFTVLGAASPDRERFRASWVQDYGKNTSVSYSGLWFKDNLNGAKNKTTHSWRPDISINKRLLLGRRFASGDVTLRTDYRRGAVKENNTYLDFGYGDRLGMFDSDTRMGLASFSKRDTLEYIANTSLSWRKSAGLFVFRPTLRLGTRIKDANGNRDLINESSLGLNADAGSAGISTAFQLGLNKYIRERENDSAKLFFNTNFYYRPVFAKNHTLSLRYAVNDFWTDHSGGDFRENSFSAGLNTQF
ncbi:MAG: hypothetical protein ACQEQC_06130 [Elusimicrobiota bacterium]